MKTTLVLALTLNGTPVNVQTYSLKECSELNGSLHAIPDQNGRKRLACLFSTNEYGWVTLDFKTLHEDKP